MSADIRRKSASLDTFSFLCFCKNMFTVINVIILVEFFISIFVKKGAMLQSVKYGNINTFLKVL